jgi:hypothetical protein
MEAIKELLKEPEIILVICLIPLGFIANNIKRNFGTT